MKSFNCKVCNRISAQYAEDCKECNEPLFCNVCGYDNDSENVVKRVELRETHKKEEHISVDIK